MKYTCLEDVTSFGVVMIKKGTVVQSGERFSASGITLELSDYLLKDNMLFAPLQMSVSSREHSEDADQAERDWVLEVKVRTTRAKLRAIEDFLSGTLPGML